MRGREIEKENKKIRIRFSQSTAVSVLRSLITQGAARFIQPACSDRGERFFFPDARCHNGFPGDLAYSHVGRLQSGHHKLYRRGSYRRSAHDNSSHTSGHSVCLRKSRGHVQLRK
ncbi:hypothetical protein RRG08_026343 [Elysia crispata]|uniref:Uncharacterized protein n=1 Tax=Elysia crispata TaxID=231223 RepID=A0AAE0XN92_9GAST|nr:hypothetical protein RRG08_026343 [Elysia crispata]